MQKFNGMKIWSEQDRNQIEEDNFNWRIYAWNIGQMSNGLWELNSSRVPWEEEKTDYMLYY